MHIAYASKHGQFVLAYVLTRQDNGFKLAAQNTITPLHASVFARFFVKTYYNCNIRHFVDNAPPPEPHDVRAHLHGGAPVSEIDALQHFWKKPRRPARELLYPSIPLALREMGWG